jgi:hypothetical protein
MIKYDNRIPPIIYCAVGPFPPNRWDLIKQVWDIFLGAGFKEFMPFEQRSSQSDAGYVWISPSVYKSLNRWENPIKTVRESYPKMQAVSPEDFLACYTKKEESLQQAVENHVQALINSPAGSKSFPPRLGVPLNPLLTMTRDEAHESGQLLEWVRANRDQVGLKAAWQTAAEAEARLIAEVKRGK